MSLQPEEEKKKNSSPQISITPTTPILGENDNGLNGELHPGVNKVVLEHLRKLRRKFILAKERDDIANDESLSHKERIKRINEHRANELIAELSEDPVLGELYRNAIALDPEESTDAKYEEQSAAAANGAEAAPELTWIDKTIMGTIDWAMWEGLTAEDFLEKPKEAKEFIVENWHKVPYAKEIKDLAVLGLNKASSTSALSRIKDAIGDTGTGYEDDYYKQQTYSDAVHANLELLEFIREIKNNHNPVLTHSKQSDNNIEASTQLFRTMMAFLDEVDEKDHSELSEGLDKYLQVMTSLDKKTLEEFGYEVPYSKTLFSDYVLAAQLGIPLPANMERFYSSESLPEMFAEISAITAAYHVLGTLKLGQQRLASITEELSSDPSLSAAERQQKLLAEADSLRAAYLDTAQAKASAMMNMQYLIPAFVLGVDGKGSLDQNTHNAMVLLAEKLRRNSRDPSELIIANALKDACTAGVVLHETKRIFGRDLGDLYDHEIEDKLQLWEKRSPYSDAVKRAGVTLGRLKVSMDPFLKLVNSLENSGASSSSPEALAAELNGKIAALEGFIAEDLGAGPEEYRINRKALSGEKS